MSRIGWVAALAVGFARLAVRAGAAEGAPSDLTRLEALIERQGRALSAQEARLADLERQNRDLQARLDALMARGAPHVPGGLATNAAAVQTAHAASPAPTAAASLLAFTKPNGFSVVPYGYFKFDAVHDSARTAFGDAAAYVLPHSLSGVARRI